MAKFKKSKRRVKRVPRDEMLLAQMIAAAEAKGLEGCAGQVFADGACCAIGGMALVAHPRAYESSYKYGTDPYKYAKPVLKKFKFEDVAVWSGNDHIDEWEPDDADAGESVGWAFRNAMAMDFGLSA